MAELDASGYTFTTVPTKTETERFEYVAFDYIEKNPGIVGNAYKSYIGVYFSDTGERSD
jgi:hypothetical protein